MHEPSGTPAVQFLRVSKTFERMRAVKDVSFEIHRGEFFSLLGPSGCGKTTTLRLLAGFEQPDEDGGEVRIGGEVVNRRRPYERDLSMVFQSYALFPHMTIARNIAFGLEQRGVNKAEIPGRVRDAMEMVQLPGDTFADRKPSQLSGGQRQRVALARALVVRPPILLLDEPLGALDLKLRKEMQVELKALNRRLGITFVYVTHDQEEALTMSDRIAVMSESRIAQLGTPANIYEQPRTAFVARFIGESNFLEGRLVGRDESGWQVELGTGDRFTVPDPAGHDMGARVLVAVRPERVTIRPTDQPPPGGNALRGTIATVVYRGENLHVRVEVPGSGVMTATAQNEGQLRQPHPWTAGDPVLVCWGTQDGRALEDDPA